MLIYASGREPMTFKYEELFNEVMGERPDIDVATRDPAGDER